MTRTLLLLGVVPLLAVEISQSRTEREIVTEDLRPKFAATDEVTLWDSTRVDLLTDTHAIEVDWAPKWAEAIGQSLYYGILTNRTPGIVLLVRDMDRERRYVYRCQTVCAAHGVRLWVYLAASRQLRG